MTYYGDMVPKVLTFNSTGHNKNDTRLVWMVDSLLSRIESLWQLVEKVEMRTSRWNGWMLNFLTKQFFDQGNRCQDKSDVF